MVEICPDFAGFAVVYALGRAGKAVDERRPQPSIGINGKVTILHLNFVRKTDNHLTKGVADHERRTKGGVFA